MKDLIREVVIKYVGTHQLWKWLNLFKGIRFMDSFKEIIEIIVGAVVLLCGLVSFYIICALFF